MRFTPATKILLSIALLACAIGAPLRMVLGASDGCRTTCDAAIARCIADGLRPSVCTREVVRQCRRGSSLCSATSYPPACVTTTTTVPTGSVTTTTLPGVCPTDGPPDPDAANVVLDCSEGPVYSRVATVPGTPELDVIGIYESRSDHSFGYHPTGEASVTITRPGPLVLVVSSYEPTHWTVTVAPGSTVERIVLNGYHQQTVTAPAGIPVDDRSPYQNWLGSEGYAWPDNDGGGNTANLISRAESAAGTCLASFHGCYHATQFRLDGPAAPPTTWTPMNFRSAASVQTPCTGARYVRYVPRYGKWVGVSLCSPDRYKIFLATDPTATFYEIGDYAGHGQDHCELVNPAFRIPDEDDITSGGCPTCNIDYMHIFDPPVGSQGWSRAVFGEQFTFESSWPQYNLYTAQWYQCGVNVP